MQDTDARTGRVAEVDALEADVALNSLGDVALGGLSADLEDGVEQADDVGGGTLGGENVGDEGEDIAGLDGEEDGGHEMRPIKNWNVIRWRSATWREPNQKTRAMVNKVSDCESALESIAVRFEWRIGPSSESL